MNVVAYQSGDSVSNGGPVPLSRSVLTPKAIRPPGPNLRQTRGASHQVQQTRNRKEPWANQAGEPSGLAGEKSQTKEPQGISGWSWYSSACCSSPGSSLVCLSYSNPAVIIRRPKDTRMRLSSFSFRIRLTLATSSTKKKS